MAVDSKTQENKLGDTMPYITDNEQNNGIKRNSLKERKKHKKEKRPESDEGSLSKLGFFERTKHLISLITVEPILAGYIMPSVLSALATQNLYLEKACRVNLGYEHHVCDALTRRETANYTLEEEAVQTLVASVAGWKTVLQSFLPCVLLLFLGAYSDRVGQRKFCMLLPIIGELLTSIGLIVNTYYFYELPVEVAAVTEAIFPALTGGWFTMFMGVFSYIGDVTTEEERTLRIGIVNLFHSVGVPVGAALSGVLFQKIGLYGVFTVSGSLYILSFIYGYFRIQEVKKVDSSMKSSKNCCEFVRNFFDKRCVKETMRVAFKKGPYNRRLRVLMLVVVLCVIIGPLYGVPVGAALSGVLFQKIGLYGVFTVSGSLYILSFIYGYFRIQEVKKVDSSMVSELAVVYLFTRYRFNWNEVDYSIFSTYAMCTSLLGTLFSVGVFSYLLKLDDAIIGIISCTSKILSGFMYAFATKSWQIYIAPLIEIFSGTSFIAMRSMVSKLVEKDELGKLNSFIGLAEAMVPLIYAPMYTTVYTATIKTFPGAFFVLGGGLTLPALAIFLWLYLANKKQTRDMHIKNEDKEKTDEKGVENKAYETEENKNAVDSNEIRNEESVKQSQIEMGITESILCNSKLQH